MVITRLNPLPIRFHCYKVLPLVYDESLSYYEQVCKIANSLNDTIKAVNDLNTAVSDLTGLSERVTELQNSMVAFENDVNGILQNMNVTLAQYDERFNEYDSRFNDLEAELIKAINNNVKALKDYIDETLAGIGDEVKIIVEKEIQIAYDNFDKMTQEVRVEFETQIRNLIASIPDLTTIEVVNPVTGTLTKVQIALDDLFMNTRYNALTVNEYNHLHLTVNDVNTLEYHSAFNGWSIITWLTEAKELFDKSLKHRMVNPITGAWEDFKKNIELNTGLLRVCGCLTVQEFGALNIIVDEFNEIGATCEQLAWESNRIFI